jgi:predicted dienelactone hydrolase
MRVDGTASSAIVGHSWVERYKLMTRIGALVALLLTAESVFGCTGPFAVGSADWNLFDAARGREIPVRVHYPAAQPGGSPLMGCAFPSLSFGHGFTIAHTAYEYLATGLAAAGVVVALPATEGGLSPNHAAFGADLRFVATTIGDHPTLVNVLGPVRAVGGHSMGGGAAVLAGTGLDGYLGLAPANTNPSAIVAAAAISVPALLITGSRDCVTPRVQHADPIFQALATPLADKRIVEIVGGSHCQFSGGSLTCSLGEQSCGGSATIGASVQQNQVLAEVVAFLRALAPRDLGFADGFE